MLHTITPTPDQWDAFVCHHTRAHPLQLSAWGDLKAAFGWQVARTGLQTDSQLVAGAQLLFKPLPARLGTMAYLPFGGYVSQSDQWPNLWQAIKQCAKQHNAAFLKWEPGFYIHDEQPDFTQWDFVASEQTIQPPRTIMIDLQADDETIMQRMNQGTRRKIRKSLKSDIDYYEGTRADIDKFNALMQVTGQRNEFGVHDPDYYARAFDLFVPHHAALLLAEHEGDVLAAIMVFAVGDTAQYLYGASSNDKRNLMASYGIQWQAIQWAKARGCHYYDMWGIPDEDYDTLEAQFQDRSDGLWGVYGFKRGWGGDVVRSAGTWDLVYNRFIYTAYRAALRIRS